MKESDTFPKSIKIGFTGTQVGMTGEQKLRFMDIFEKFKYPVIEFHHGDCIGADWEAHTLVCLYYPEITIHIHPPNVVTKRAFAHLKHIPKNLLVHKPADYLGRNHIIVNSTDILIATPKDFSMVMRSGTWATIRYAGKNRKPVIRINPDGSISDGAFLGKISKSRYNKIIELEEL